MKKRFPLHDEETAPREATAILEQIKENFGMIPNLERVMATAPVLLEAYCALSQLFAKSSFNSQEQEVIYQTINVEHGCGY